MGLGCPNSLLRHQDASLPVLNMIVLGFPHSGKSTLIDRLGLDRQDKQTQDCSIERVQLQIGSFVLQKSVKIIAFEVSSAVKTWKYYYVNAHILLFLADAARLQREGGEHAKTIVDVVKEIDENAPENCQLIMVFSKSELVKEASEGERVVVKALGELKHEAITVRYSGATGQGLDKITQSALFFHKNIHL